MIRIATNYPPQVNGLLAGCGFLVRLELPAGSPFVDGPTPGMFRSLGNLHTEIGQALGYRGINPAPLATIPDDERLALLVSLSTTIARATYHHERFQFLVENLVERRRLTGAGHGHDDLTRFAFFEAASMIGAIRGAVDEIVFIAARRGGGAGRETDGWRAHALITDDQVDADKDVEDIRVLRAHADWFRELNEYRNALVHRGSRHTIGGGYYPIGDMRPEATDPEFNVFLVPDRESLRAHARPHQWTYTRGNRVDLLVERLWNGFEPVLLQLGQVWGGAPAPPGRIPIAERPNLVMAVDQPSCFIGRDDSVYVGVFTSVERAHAFVANFGTPQSVGPIVPLRPCMLNDDSRYYLSMPSGASLRDGNVPRQGGVKFALDLTCHPETKVFDYRTELGNLSLELLMTHEHDSMLLEFPASDVPGDEVFIIRRHDDG